MTDEENVKVAFYTLSTNSPVIQIFYEPQMSLFELVIEIGSIISIWFGLSVIKMNPFRKGKFDVYSIDLLSITIRSFEKHLK